MRCYIDVISPYAYLGWRRVHELADRLGRSVDVVPILFAALLSHHGHRGPAEIPPKRVYTFKHVVRIAHELGIPIGPPPHHPFNPLLALRVITAAKGGAHERAVIDAIFDAVWAGDGGGAEDAVAIAACLDARGLPAAELLAAAVTPEVKLALRAATDDAIAAGVFGVPTIELDGELFWGQDAFGHVEAFAAGRDPVAAVAARWARVTPNATRER